MPKPKKAKEEIVDSQDDSQELEPEPVAISTKNVCPICGASKTKAGKPFAKWTSVRSHMTASHSTKVKGKMLSESDIRNWSPSDSETTSEDDPPRSASIPRKRERTMPDNYKRINEVLMDFGADTALVYRCNKWMTTTNKNVFDLDDVAEIMKYVEIASSDQQKFLETWAKENRLGIPLHIIDEFFDKDDRSHYPIRRSSYGADGDNRERRQEVRGLGRLEAENESLKDKLQNVPTAKDMMELQMQMMNEQRQADKDARARDREHDLEVRQLQNETHRSEMDNLREMMKLQNEADAKNELLTVVDKVSDKMDSATNKLINVAAMMAQPAGSAPNLTKRPSDGEDDEGPSVADGMDSEFVIGAFEFKNT